MDCSMPGLPVHHQLPELTQTHVQWVGDAIQPSHPLSSPSPPAFNPSQHQGLFQWVIQWAAIKYYLFRKVTPKNFHTVYIIIVQIILFNFKNNSFHCSPHILVRFFNLMCGNWFFVLGTFVFWVRDISFNESINQCISESSIRLKQVKKYKFPQTSDHLQKCDYHRTYYAYFETLKIICN